MDQSEKFLQNIDKYIDDNTNLNNGNLQFQNDVSKKILYVFLTPYNMKLKPEDFENHPSVDNIHKEQIKKGFKELESKNLIYRDSNGYVINKENNTVQVLRDAKADFKINMRF